MFHEFQTAPAERARGGALASLGGHVLGARFYAWRGASGARYICSVFDLADDALIAGFSGAAIVGVMRDGAAREPVCVMSSRQFDDARGRLIRGSARRLGIAEWHVHFDADAADLQDLAGMLAG